MKLFKITLDRISDEGLSYGTHDVFVRAEDADEAVYTVIDRYRERPLHYKPVICLEIGNI